MFWRKNHFNTLSFCRLKLLADSNPAADAAHVLATPAKSCCERLLFPGAIVHSKNAKLLRPPSPATRRVLRLFVFVQDDHAANRPIQCSKTLPRRKNPRCNFQTTAVAGICKRRIGGHAATTTSASLPMYPASADCGRAESGFLVIWASQLFVSHISPHPNPLPWGEGTAVGHLLKIRGQSRSSQRWICQSAANVSPSPPGRGPG